MDATVHWDLPDVDENGDSLDPRDVAGVMVELRVAGGNFSELQPLVPRDTLQHTTEDLEVGDWEFRLTAIGTNGKASPTPVVEAFYVPSAAAPGPVLNTRVVLS